MSDRYILAIDQGTTNTKAILVDTNGSPVSMASAPMTSVYPEPGWAEQSAEAIWESVRDVLSRVMQGFDASKVLGIAISNQRETLVAFDAETGQPIAPAILWQCRRSAQICDRLVDAGYNDLISDKTGLALNPLFPASKITWLLQKNALARRLFDEGRLRAGTVDSWLCYKLTGGKNFVTDHSNAARTQLFDIRNLRWDEDICAIFGLSSSILPEPKPSDFVFGQTEEGVCALPAGIPILAVMGDSHAALYGHGVRSPGQVKATYGTGSSLMTITRDKLTSNHGLSSTIAWTDKNGTYYALEGNITVSGQAAAFVASLTGVETVTALSDLAQTVPDAMGVAFVPALSGLGAPHWNDRATGTITGMTLGTTKAHLARATFEAIALQVCDVFEAMERDASTTLTGILADGGASSNDFLMQLQADLVNRQVLCSDRAEISALGVAHLALSSLGHEVADSNKRSRVFRPSSDWDSERETIHRRWKAAIRGALGAGDIH